MLFLFVLYFHDCRDEVPQVFAILKTPFVNRVIETMTLKLKLELELEFKLLGLTIIPRTTKLGQKAN